jgi:transcriptional regulator with XRE-family HTH domain
MEEQFNEEMISKRIRNLRESKNMTLNDLAKKIDVSSSYISKLERSKKSPPISILYKISKAFKTDLNYIITGFEVYKNTKISVIRKSEQIKVIGRNRSGNYDYFSLAYKKDNKLMEPFILEISNKSKAEPYTHDGEEFNYVLKGKVVFIIENDIFELNEGDSIYFESELSHIIKNLDKNDKSVLISINTVKKDVK